MNSDLSSDWVYYYSLKETNIDACNANVARAWNKGDQILVWLDYKKLQQTLKLNVKNYNLFTILILYKVVF